MAKVGPFFSAEEKAFPARAAVVYVYWPWEERGRQSQLWVQPCGNGGNEVLPGGYTSFVVEPGPSCFQAERQWDFAAGRGDVSEELGKVEFQGEPGHSYFIRLERKKVLFMSRFGLRRVEPETAKPEIRRCRRSIPLSMDEIPARNL